MSSTWIVYDEGKRGSLSQCEGLATCLGLSPAIYPATLHPWARWIPYRIWPSLKLVLRKPLPASYPGLIIASGHQSARIAAWIRAYTGQKTKVFYLMDPHLPLRAFDKVIAPQHDRLQGPNVISTIGVLGRLTPESLNQAHQEWAPLFQPLASPRIAVLIGGSSKHFRVNRPDAEALLNTLKDIHAHFRSSMMVTYSRRTDAVLKDTLTPFFHQTQSYVWDDQGDNPYLGLLAWADAVIVTGDSISMISEACLTGKPVYIAPFHSRTTKFRSFYQNLEAHNHASLLSPDLNLKTFFQIKPQVLWEARRVAKILGPSL
jgi:mitochondrial fission protein ELM1